LTTFCITEAQNYTIRYKNINNDSLPKTEMNLLQTSFPTRSEPSLYVFQLPASLRAKGFITASIDSVHYDSLSATVSLYMGEQYKWAKIKTLPKGEAILEAVRWPRNSFSGPVDFVTLQAWQQKILDHLEEN